MNSILRDKSFYVLFILLVPFMGFSQSLSVLTDPEGPPLFFGEEITVTQQSTSTEIECMLYVRNNSDDALNIKARKIELEVLENTENYFCWGDACLPPTFFESTSAFNIMPGATTAEGDFSGHYNPKGNSGTTKMMYVFFDEDNPTDSTAVIVNYAAGETGYEDYYLQQISFSNTYPNPATDNISFDYSFPAEVKSATLNVYDKTGKRIADFLLDTNSGTFTLSVGHFATGSYFWNLIIDKYPIKSGQVVVK